MASILEQIRGWASGLKYWEQAALEKIAAGLELTENDYEELMTFWEQDARLSPTPPDRPLLHFSDPVAETPHRSVRLSRLYNLANVNALPPGQELPFGPQLTLIFGANGAGKTGYARPLGCAAFTRGSREVLPNAGDANQGRAPAADIEIFLGGQETPIQVHWGAGNRCASLAGFYVFDAESLNAHLLGPNEMSVTPSALSLLTRLADETDEVRERVRAEIRKRSAPHSFAPIFPGDSPISSLLASLGPATDIARLHELAVMTDEDNAQIKQLEKEIAELRLHTSVQRLKMKRLQLSDIELLLRRLQGAAAATDQASADTARKLVEDLQQRQRLAEQFGAGQFECKPFSQVGTGIWFEFVAAAKKLAQAEEEASGIPYPRQDTPCLLCQQPLSNAAADLISRLWQLLASDAQRCLEDARRACADRARQLEAITVDYFANDSSVRRLLETNLQNVVPRVEAHAESAAARIKELASSLREGAVKPLPPLTPLDTTELLRLVEILKAEIHNLQESKEGEHLAACEAALRRLQHRKTLAANLPAVERYVRERKWAEKAERELGTTGNITRKYNEIFESLVTERYKAIFQSILGRFGRNLRVSVDARGHKGQTVRQIILSRDDFPSEPPISRILSDGEKRAVALADFLAEAGVDESCDGLVLDDPVTSFDAGWKKELAAYLVERAGAGLQVIVFTHDLPFLHHVRAKAAESDVGIRAHWVAKRENAPGFLAANNSPVCEKDFRTAKHAEECLTRSRGLPPEEQQRMLEQGFDALRTSYEALVVFELFNGVVERFEERLHLDRLKEVSFDANIAREVHSRWAELSRFIGGHLHSDIYSAQKPSPEKLREEINAFNDLRRRAKDSKKGKAPASGGSPRSG